MERSDRNGIASNEGVQMPTAATPEQLQALTLELLQRMDKRLALLESRLPVTNSPEHQKAQQPAFPKFNRLPPELRRNIWVACLPRRKLRIFDPRNARSRGYLRKSRLGLPPPVVSQVCRESRAVAERTGGMNRLAYKQSYWSHGGLWRNYPPLYWTWFDGVRDVLELDISCAPGTEATPTGLWNIIQQSRSIVIQEKEVRDQWLQALFHNKANVSSLRTIYIMPHRPETASRLGWGYQAVNDFFGSDSFTLVDLEKNELIEAVSKFLSARVRSQQSDFPLWVPKWEAASGGDYRTEACARAEAVIRSAWIYSSHPELQEGAEETRSRHGASYSVDMENPLLPETIASMPRIRTVYAFELEDETRPVMYEDFPLRTPSLIRDLDGEPIV